jgi:hypothetical protein
LDTQAYELEEVTNPRRLQLEECTAPIFEMYNNKIQDYEFTCRCTETKIGLFLIHPSQNKSSNPKNRM